MVSKSYVRLLADLVAQGSYNHSYRSNDNPYSESRFRKMKYHHTYVTRFGLMEDAQSWAVEFFAWFNFEFYLSGIALTHPAADQVWQARQRVMEEAYARHPRRFPNGVPQLPRPPHKVRINKRKRPVNGILTGG